MSDDIDFLTARRSTGKTAFLNAAMFAIILGDEKVLGVKVKKGRVAYITLENPTDLRLKMEVARFHLESVSLLGRAISGVAEVI